MVNMSTRYLGLDLSTPLVASASPLSGTVEGVKELEDNGIGAVVLFSLFEEQLTLSPHHLHQLMGVQNGGYAEAISLASTAPHRQMDPLDYLEHVHASKAAVDIPIIASINGTPHQRWTHYIKLLQQAGADAVELNLYHIPTNPLLSSYDLEESILQTIRAVKATVEIPIAVKLHPFITSLPHFAQRMHEAGADALVLFNRFYQPEVDLENLRAKSKLTLSTSEDLKLVLRWLHILKGQLGAEMAATGGIHTSEDALKALAMGANVTMVCSSLLKHGVGHLKTIQQGMRIWLEARDYQNINSFVGAMSNCIQSKEAVERAQYIRTLDSYSMH